MAHRPRDADRRPLAQEAHLHRRTARGQLPDCVQFGVTEISADAALSIGIASKPLPSCTNSRAPGGSGWNAYPEPPPSTLPAASKTTAERVAFCRVKAGSLFCTSPSIVPSHFVSYICGTRCMFASVGLCSDRGAY